MKSKRTYGPIPLPRLKHIQPGQFFTLRQEEASHGCTILATKFVRKCS